MTERAKLLAAVRELAKTDPDFQLVLTRYGPPGDRFEKGGFAALVRIILGQQISRAVAVSLWTRLSEKGWTEARPLALCEYGDLQALGLSQRKAEYIIDLARAEMSGALNLSQLSRQPANIFTQTLISYRGVGAWTISNYRLFCLADLDAWPGNDLALMEAVRRLKGLNERPDHKTMDKLALNWQPWRGAAALLLWHYYACEVRDARPVGGKETSGK